MASKIMLVIDSQEDQDFLEKVLVRLKYTVISMKRGVELSEQLIDHFPDVVFASTLGRNAKILNALGKIKEVRGKPKLVFVKTKNEKNLMTNEQKDIIDGTLYTPIDPFKLIDLLSNTTELDLIELRRRYNEMLEQDRGRRLDQKNCDLKVIENPEEAGGARKNPISVTDTPQQNFGSTQVFGTSPKKINSKIQNDDPEFYGTAHPDDFDSENATNQATDGNQEGATPFSTASEDSSDQRDDQVEARPGGKSPSVSYSLIEDTERRKKYAEVVQRLKDNNEPHQQFDVQKLREKQKAQSQEISENSEVKANRKHFLKTLFSMSPDQVRKKG